MYVVDWCFRAFACWARDYYGAVRSPVHCCSGLIGRKRLKTETGEEGVAQDSFFRDLIIGGWTIVSDEDGLIRGRFPCFDLSGSRAEEEGSSFIPCFAKYLVLVGTKDWDCIEKSLLRKKSAFQGGVLKARELVGKISSCSLLTHCCGGLESTFPHGGAESVSRPTSYFDGSCGGWWLLMSWIDSWTWM